MAIVIDYSARFAVPPAGNADLNPLSSKTDPSFTVLFSSSPDGVTPNPTGDLTLDNIDDAGGLDTNTWVSIDGGLTWHQFDVLFYGALDPNNAQLYDGSTGGPSFLNSDVLSVELNDGLGTRIFFFPEETYSPTELNFMPHGAVNVIYDDGGIIPGDPPPICFVGGTLITTVATEVAVEDLKIGDVVMTRDNGPQTISWIGKRNMSSNTSAHLQPIRIKANALGVGLPKRDLLVSPQHRILLSDWRAELMFGESEVLVAAKHLVNDGDIRVAADLNGFEYFHILFENHQTVFSEGLPSESFHPGDFSMKTLSEESRAEVLELFPELANDVASYGPATHTSLKAFEAKALQSA